MEGVSYESASLAGHLKLDNLIYLYDDNNITIDGSTDLAFTEDRTKRFEAAGWHVSEVADGNDLKAIEQAIKRRAEDKGKPKLIRVKTIIGFGMPKQGTSKGTFGRPGRGSREAKQNAISAGPRTSISSSRKKLSRIFAKAVKNGARLEKDWEASSKKYEKEFPDLGKAFADTRERKLPDGWEKSLAEIRQRRGQSDARLFAAR